MKTAQQEAFCVKQYGISESTQLFSVHFGLSMVFNLLISGLSYVGVNSFQRNSVIVQK